MYVGAQCQCTDTETGDRTAKDQTEGNDELVSTEESTGTAVVPNIRQCISITINQLINHLLLRMYNKENICYCYAIQREQVRKA